MPSAVFYTAIEELCDAWDADPNHQEDYMKANRGMTLCSIMKHELGHQFQAAVHEGMTYGEHCPVYGTVMYHYVFSFPFNDPPYWEPFCPLCYENLRDNLP